MSKHVAVMKIKKYWAHYLHSATWWLFSHLCNSVCANKIIYQLWGGWKNIVL